MLFGHLLTVAALTSSTLAVPSKCKKPPAATNPAHRRPDSFSEPSTPLPTLRATNSEPPASVPTQPVTTTLPPSTVPTQPATTTQPPPAGGKKGKFLWFGVNESGAEFGEKTWPGALGKEYTWYNFTTMDMFIDAGMNMLRINFRESAFYLHAPTHTDS